MTDMSLFKKIRTFTNNFNLLDFVKGIYKFCLFKKSLIIKISDINQFIEIDFFSNSCKPHSGEKKNMISLYLQRIYYICLNFHGGLILQTLLDL